MKQKSIAAIAEAEAAARTPMNERDGKEAGLNGAGRPTLNRTITRQSVQVKTKTYVTKLKRCFVDPLHIILYLQFPAVAVCVFYATTTFCALYSAYTDGQDRTFGRDVG